LVHLSELANGFVRDPRQIVSVGQTVKVKVVSVDVDKPRISLSIKALQSAKPRRSDKGPRRKPEAVQTEQGEAQPRARREDAPRRPSRRDEGERSPDRREAKGPQRRQKDRQQRPKKKSAGLPDQDNSPLTNNPLAEQLAALKDRFGS
jgi:predicted RNA-binding protein with RPS1 domain